MEEQEGSALAWVIGGVVAAAGITGVILWRRQVHAEHDRAVAAARAAAIQPPSTQTTAAPAQPAQLPPPRPLAVQVPASPARTPVPAPSPTPAPPPARPPALINDPIMLDTPPSAPLPAPAQRTASAPHAATPAEKYAAMVNLLRHSEEARENFGFQSLLWSWEYTDAVPDGVMGPVTRGLIKQINLAENPLLLDLAHASDRFDRQLMNRAMIVLHTRIGFSPNRMLPFTLPADVVHLANATLNRMSPNIAVLQVNVA